MRKHLITLGIWLIAVLVLTLVYWSSASNAWATVGASTPAPATEIADRGRALFMAKSCAACHVHAAAPVESLFSGVGPNLTHYQADPALLQRWLSNPQSIRPNTRMPHLNLKPEEIDALIAFLAANR